MRNYPALCICTAADPDLVAATVDDFHPTAIEPRERDVRVFFANAHDRDAAQRALRPTFDVSAVDVSDEDWARRSQDNLQPIAVGRLIVVPSADRSRASIASVGAVSDPLAIVIVPSMGFGTGHHATTRLCLEALQDLNLAGRAVLDVGTGSASSQSRRRSSGPRGLSAWTSTPTRFSRRARISN